MKTRTHITLLLFLAFLGLVGLFGGSVYFFLNKYSYNDLYKRLETRARIAADHHFSEDTLQAEALLRAKETYLEKLPEEREYLLPPLDGASMSSTAKSTGIPRELLKSIATDGLGTGKRGETFFAGVRHVVGNEEHWVVVSAHNYYASHHLSYLRGLLWALMLLTAIFTVLFFLYFRRHLFDPIARITERLRHISTENMHLRLPEAVDNKELRTLVTTANGLLDRMETAFETQKNFISNASHEFGTPLTSIIGEAEVALAKDRDPEEYRASISAMLQQAERLNKIVRSLLFLAKTGYTNKTISFTIVRMDAVVWTVKELMDDLHPGNNITIDLSLLPEDPRKLKVHGNADLLHLAIANIVNNAFKYSSNKPVTVSVAAAQNEVVVLVKDHGIGIPADELQFIYDPFFRASNTSYFEGYGIGMPLARNVVKLHNGTLHVSSQSGIGTTVQVNIPTIDQNF
ncbi:MAG: two-component sensor histidine kinase [Flavobacteriales bacterium]|nr:two-component sensor histidine kinase [Flavobacteriales bacterium]